MPGWPHHHQDVYSVPPSPKTRCSLMGSICIHWVVTSFLYLKPALRLSDFLTCWFTGPWEHNFIFSCQSNILIKVLTTAWIFIVRTEAEVPILWPPDGKSQLIGKDPDAGKDWRQEEDKGTTEDEMVGWHHQLNGQEFEQAPGVGDGQGSLACHSPWGCKESDTT